MTTEFSIQVSLEAPVHRNHSGVPDAAPIGQRLWIGKFFVRPLALNISLKVSNGPTFSLETIHKGPGTGEEGLLRNNPGPGHVSPS